VSKSTKIQEEEEEEEVAGSIGCEEVMMQF
jgi:hypothetical protein